MNIKKKIIFYSSECIEEDTQLRHTQSMRNCKRLQKAIALVSIVVTLFWILLPTNTFAFTIQDGIVSGIMWEDENNNEIQEISEPGLKGIKISMQNLDTNEIFTTETVEGGGFTFFDLIPGFYQLWYEHDNTISNFFDVQIDELNGIGSINIPVPTVDKSIETASMSHHHTIYLPIIIH